MTRGILIRSRTVPTLKSGRFPPPRSWEEFEILCADLFRHVWKDPGTQRNGRTGQPQHGVDVFGRPDGGPHYSGVQARNKVYLPSAVTVAELREEVEKAKGFVPALKSFVLATTAPNDATIQEEARRLTEANEADGLFSIEVWGWDEIESRMAECPDVVINHYPQFALAKGATDKEGHPDVEGPPTFTIEHQPDSEGWIHLKVTSLTGPGEFYADVTELHGSRSAETTPFPVKWRGPNVERKFVPRDGLIDLGRFLWHPAPDINADDSGVIFVRMHGKLRNGWDSGYWELFSYFKPDGWVVEAADHVPDDPTMPTHVRLFFEEIRLVVRVVRLDSDEEHKWRVTLGFVHPTQDASGRWILPAKGDERERVEIEEVC